MKTAVALLFLIVYVVPLGVRPLLVPDEARYCEVPREMIRSGDWIVPRLNGVRYFEKPVLGYWAVGGSMLAFGENVFAARLPSALAAGLAALLIGWLARRAGVEPTGVALAPAVYLTSSLVYIVGTSNILDSMFAAMLTAALASFFAYHTESVRRRQNLLLAAFGAFCGLAFLIKGFAAFVLAGGVVLVFALWERRLGELLRRAWIPICATLIVALPWSIAIAIREPDYWRYTILVQHLDRFAGSMDEQRSHPFWYMPLILLLGTYPWNMFLLSITEGLRRVRPADPLMRFALCWFVFPYLFFSVSTGKLGTYLLPCFPSISLLVTLGLLGYFRESKARAFNAGVICVAVIPAVSILLILAPGFANVFNADVFGGNESLKRVLALLGFSVCLALLVAALRTTGFRSKLAFVCGALAVVLALAPVALPVERFSEAMPGRFLEKYASRIDPSTTIISDRAMVHAVCWFWKRDDVLLLDRRAGELAYGLGQEARGRVVGLDRFLELTSAGGGSRVAMVLPANFVGLLRLIKLPRPLPAPRFEAVEGDLWYGEF